jgi:hypothetical protein
MGDVVSLKLHRKRKARAEREAEADQNRIDHGLTRQERELIEARNEKAAKDLDGNKRDE